MRSATTAPASAVQAAASAVQAAQPAQPVQRPAQPPTRPAPPMRPAAQPAPAPQAAETARAYPTAPAPQTAQAVSADPAPRTAQAARTAATAPAAKAPKTPKAPRTPQAPKAYRPAKAPRLAAGRRIPGPRLTGLGTGALATAVCVLAATADSLLFHGPGVLFGVVFVLVSVAGALYVRPYDLVAAPVAAPIAFATGIALTADSGDGGLAGHVIGVFTTLALMTGWLYTGTVLAAVIVGVRALLLPSRRRRYPRCSGVRRERSPR